MSKRRDEEKLNGIFRLLMRLTRKNKVVQTIVILAFIVLGGTTYVLNNEGKINLPVDLPTTKVEQPTDNLRYCQIDVGQGDSSLIQVNGMTVLVDAGPRSGADEVVSHLKEHGIKTIDIAIATHSHEDHIGGFPKVFEEFNVTRYFQADSGHSTQIYNKTVQAIKDEGIAIEKIDDNTKLDLGRGTYVDVLDDGVYDGDNLNDYSPVLHIVHGESSILLSGDAEKDVEERVLAMNRNIPDVQVMKAAHHGSDTSNSEEFISSLDPELVLVSCGADNKYGHPHTIFQRTLSKLKIPFLRTDQDGTIELISNGKIFEVINNNELNIKLVEED